MISSPPFARDLRAALSAGELSVVYQGQYDLEGATAPGAEPPVPVVVEALARWDHAVFGAVPPDRFIPLAEGAEFLDEVDADIFQRAAAQVTRWHEAGIAVSLSVNASPAHFSSRYADDVMVRLDDLGLDPSTVTIEITESPTPQLRPLMLSAVEALRAIGVGISVDDFAAEDTTLAMLDLLPIDEVKIDRSLTRRTDAAAHDAVAAVAEAGARRGWRVVAEGIETAGDLERAVARGCDRGQGYLWGMPLPAADMEAVLRR